MQAESLGRVSLLFWISYLMPCLMLCRAKTLVPRPLTEYLCRVLVTFLCARQLSSKIWSNVARNVMFELVCSSRYHTPVPGKAPFLFRTTMACSREMYPFIRPCDNVNGSFGVRTEDSYLVNLVGQQALNLIVLYRLPAHPQCCRKVDERYP